MNTSRDLAIRVEELGKAYRIGLKEQQHETMLGAMAAWIKSPFENFRSVRKLSHFDEVKTEDRRSKMEDSVRVVDRRSKMEDGSPISQLPSAISQSATDSHLPSSAPGSPSSISHLPSSTLSSPEDVIWALRDVSFEVKHGEAVGIIGRNGAGKSTLLKILSRITEPTTGRATVYGRVGSLLEVGTGFHPDLTGRENVYLNGTILGMKKREIDARFDEIVEFSGVEKFIDTPVKRYSSGMRVRLAFSVAAHLEPEILIVDEVLAVGDAEFQKRCLGKMEDVASQGRTVLFVSHNMEAVLTLCARGVILTEGQVSFIGDAPEAVQLYQRASLDKASDHESHVVWENPAADRETQPCVERVEVLALDGRPKAAMQTWDDVRFRVHYSAPESIKSGSVVLEIRDYRDTRLIVMDSGLGLRLRAGRHYVDCVVQCLPLAAGDYFVGVGLALSNTQWLWRNTNVGTIIVNGRDVFDSGRPPVNSRMVFAVPHEWSSPA